MAAALVAQKDFSQFGFVASVGAIVPAEVYAEWGSALTNRLQYGDVAWTNLQDEAVVAAPAGEPVAPSAEGELDLLADPAPAKKK